ncbi:MAG: PadR family transcriptional regulator [Chloroflexi bacterium]|nr:PadR family transcriptional regulator [Chloroflexota bacterium]
MGLETSEYWDLLINRSVSRFFLLAALAEGPAHGYQLAKAVEEATSACCTPSAAMVYPALRELVEQGCIVCVVERNGARERKVCTLTPLGWQVYRTAARSWSRIFPALQAAVSAAERGEHMAPTLASNQFMAP